MCSTLEDFQTAISKTPGIWQNIKYESWILVSLSAIFQKLRQGIIKASGNLEE
jgi:hypothetical protein